MSELLTGDGGFRRHQHHRRLTIQYPPDAVSPLIRIEVIWDERDKRAALLADDASKALEMLALKRILDDKTPIVVRTKR